MSARAYARARDARAARAHREEVERLRARVAELEGAGRTMLDALGGAGQERLGVGITIAEAVAQLRAALPAESAAAGGGA